MAFGEALERDATQVIRAEGGTVSGGVRHPFGASDFSSPLLQTSDSRDAARVMEKIKELTVNDFMTKQGTVRGDGRVLRDVYLFQVKAPSESKSEWDLYKLLATIPAGTAFSPLDQGG